MTAVSARKLAANRANARASTGPRTAAGKARSARNAVRHGLCSKAWTDPEVGCAIERWGRRLAGEATGEERELAYRIAAAQVELERVQEARATLYNADPRIVRAVAVGGPVPFTLPDADEIDAVEELLCDAVWQLDALKRYDDRAHALRQRTNRRLEDPRAGAPPRQPRPRGLRLPRWRLPRLPDPFGRVIKFAGVPWWAWWRPDPLDEPPKRRRAPRRKSEPDGPSELEFLLRPELLARLPAMREPPLPFGEIPPAEPDATTVRDAFDRAASAPAHAPMSATAGDEATDASIEDLRAEPCDATPLQSSPTDAAAEPLPSPADQQPETLDLRRTKPPLATSESKPGQLARPGVCSSRYRHRARHGRLAATGEPRNTALERNEPTAVGSDADAASDVPGRAVPMGGRGAGRSLVLPRLAIPAGSDAI